MSYYSLILLNNDIINNKYFFRHRNQKNYNPINAQQSIVVNETCTKDDFHQKTEFSINEVRPPGMMVNNFIVAKTEGKNNIKRSEQSQNGKSQFVLGKRRDLSFGEIICVISLSHECCRKTREKFIPKFFVDLRKEVVELFDIFTYVRNVQEIKRLKSLLFTNSKLYVFNNLTKPVYQEGDLFKRYTKDDYCISKRIPSGTISTKLLKIENF